MSETVKRNGILVEEKERKVGSIYEDEWQGQKIRFHNHEEETQEILHYKALEEKVICNNWSMQKIETPSDCYKVVKETIVNHLCSDCEQDAMYDTEQGEFYCPRCSE